MRFGLEEMTLQKIISVFVQFPAIEKVVLYGSRAKGTFRNGSDIDLTFYGENLKLQTIYRIDEALDDCMTPYMFDLSIFTHISNDDLIKHIERCGVVIYEKDQLNPTI